MVNVVDATKLERHLYLTLQFMELGAPILLALNMMDDVRHKGMSIDVEKLSQGLGCPVVGTVARTGEGKPQLLDQITLAASNHTNWQSLQISYGPDIDPALDQLVALIEQHHFLTDRYPARWLAIKYLEDDEQIVDQGLQTNKALADDISSIVDSLRDHCTKTLNSFPEAIIADYRYGFIHSLLKQGIVTYPENVERLDLTDNMDKVLTHKVFGPLLMMALLYLMFQITFTLGDYPLRALEFLFSWLGNTVASRLPDGYLQSLIVSGVIDGVGGVLSFVPLIVIMFVMIAFLEDCGYMARVAYMMDKIFRTFGLHGSSVMPFIISGGIAGGCAVPGVMAARTLRSPERKAGNNSHGSVYALWRKNTCISTIDWRLLLRIPSTDHVCHYAYRLDHGPTRRPSATFHVDPGRIDTFRHGITSVPLANRTGDRHPHVGAHLGVHQESGALSSWRSLFCFGWP